MYFLDLFMLLCVPLTYCSFSCSHINLCPTLWDSMNYSMLGSSVPHCPGVCSNSCPLSQWCYLRTSSSAIPFSFCLLCFPPSFFSSELTLHIRWPKYWSFNCTNSPSNEYLGLISFRIDWFDFLAVQKTLKSLLQHHKQKASILWCSTFPMDQLSHTYMITGKAIALIIWTLVGKVISLLFNILCGFVIDFNPRSKSLLISWL